MGFLSVFFSVFFREGGRGRDEGVCRLSNTGIRYECIPCNIFYRKGFWVFTIYQQGRTVYFGWSAKMHIPTNFSQVNIYIYIEV